MIRWITVARDERVAVLVNGRFARLLTPGRHIVWTAWRVVELQRFDIKVVRALDVLDALPRDHEGTRIVQIGQNQRGLVMKDGLAFAAIRAGAYRIWDALGELQVRVFDLHDEPEALARGDRIAGVMPGVTEEAADADQALVLMRDGRAVRALPAGRYRVFAEGPYTLQAVPLTLQAVELAAQDLLTGDQVPVRIKPVVTFRVTDARVYVSQISPGQSQVYNAVQIALREAVAGRGLDTLVTERETLSADLLARAQATLAPVGVALQTAYVKDVILSAEVKELVARVTLARKEAEALEIRRRQEVATTRQLANTAKLLEQSPVLLRLKELEAMSELAGRVDKLVVVGGADMMQRISLQDV